VNTSFMGLTSSRCLTTVKTVAREKERVHSLHHDTDKVEPSSKMNETVAFRRTSLSIRPDEEIDVRLQVLPRAVAASAIAVTSVVASLTLSVTTPAYASSTTVPHCRASQIRETLRPVKVAKNAQESYRAWVTITNTGGQCNVSIVDIGLVALSGSTVLEASATPTSSVSDNILLRTGQSARAQIDVMRTGGSAFPGNCKLKAANTLEVLPLNHGLPEKLFHLSPTVLVCTGGDVNLVGDYLSTTSQR